MRQVFARLLRQCFLIPFLYTDDTEKSLKKFVFVCEFRPIFVLKAAGADAAPLRLSS